MKRSLLFLFTLLIVLSACNLPQKVENVPAPTVEVAADAAVEAEAEAAPEPTATPLPAAEKIVIVNSDSAPSANAFLNQAIASLQAEGCDVSAVSSSAELPADADFAVFANVPGDLVSLVEQYPDTQIIVTASEAAEADSVWTILFDEAYLPFVAGAALELNAYDHRGVGLLPNDSSAWGSRAEEAFTNGGQYVCGDCRGQLSPYVNFPLVYAQPSASSPDTWSAQIDEAQKSFIYTAFLAEESVSDTLLQKLVGSNVLMIGNGEMPAGMENNWLASINLDFGATILDIVSQSEAGTKSGSVGAELVITPGSLTEDFSVGKSDYLEDIYNQLVSGELSAYDPTAEYAASE